MEIASDKQSKYNMMDKTTIQKVNQKSVKGVMVKYPKCINFLSNLDINAF